MAGTADGRTAHRRPWARGKRVAASGDGRPAGGRRPHRKQITCGGRRAQHPGPSPCRFAAVRRRRGPHPAASRLSLSQNSLGEGPGLASLAAAPADPGIGSEDPPPRRALTLPLRGCPSPKTAETAWERDLGSLRSRLHTARGAHRPSGPADSRGPDAETEENGTSPSPPLSPLLPVAHQRCRSGRRERGCGIGAASGVPRCRGSSAASCPA